ncbi:MAG: TlpA family protein disulfide reductase [Maledivibacter sp.]|nr:TlpA family protein disulfide reductase [Maledivibacter sp.]
MKRSFIFILCMLMLFAAGCSNGGNNAVSNEENLDKNPIAGNVISSFNTYDIKGNEISNDIFKNHKITMINVWGTFCGPCIEEMPDLQKIYTEYKGENFNLIGIVSDIRLGQDTKEAASIVSQTKVEYTNILADDVLSKEVLSYFDYVPYTIFVDSEGNILKTLVSGSRSYEKYKEIIDNLIKNMK